MGTLVFQATLGGQVNLTGPNTASTFTISVPAITGTMITSGDTGTVTNTMLASSVYTAPGTIGSGTPNTGSFTTLTTSGAVTINGGTANGVAYLNGSKVLTTGSALVFDGSNLGLGVTPSAWNTSWKVIDVGARTSFANNGVGNTSDIWHNSYVNTAGDAIYKQTAAASFFRLDGGSFRFFNAPSGTAGNAITFTQAMTLDASGRLTVGYTSASNNETFGASGTIISKGNTINTFAFDQAGFDYNNSTKEGRFFSTASGGAGYMAFYTGSGTERARIDSSGNLIQTVNTTAATLTTNQTLTFSIVNNSLLRISVRGSDGTTRTATLALT
jgi:hypothetical protein